MDKEKLRMKAMPHALSGVQSSNETVPYGIRLLEAPSKWEQGYDGEGVVVAVLDSGCQPDHPDLKENIIDGRNFTNEGWQDDFKDYNGHGTHVAGTIAAHTTKSGVHGMAPGAKLLICKVLDQEGSGYYDWIIEGINYAIDWRGPKGEKVSVINMSLGGPHDEPNLRKAILRAIENNIAVVVASGNEGDADEETFEYGYPAYYNEVISVGAIDDVEQIADFSNVNLELDVVAPGVGIVSTYPGSKYAVISGTSMAAPHVSGALALLKQQSELEFRRAITESELYGQLVKNTVSLGYRKSTEGNGIVKFGVLDKVKSLIDFIHTNF